MSVGPRIELKQTQTLRLTPQLRQSIQLLQMSGQELINFVATEVEKNPLLDLATPSTPGVMSPAARSGTTDDAMARIAAHVTIWDHLHSQIHQMRAMPEVIDAALALADELEEDGYLRVAAGDICTRHGFSNAVFTKALALVQGCDPVGIGARSLRECLALQLRDKDRLDPAMQIMLDNLHLIAAASRNQLIRLCELDRDDIDDMIAELRALDPKPGLKFSTAPIQTAIPDIHVSRTKSGVLRVDLNTDALPRVLMNNLYRTEIDRGDDEARSFVSECRASGNWLIRALEQRARTLHKVGVEIVRQQERFFHDGPAALNPLTRKEIAARTGFHESTISRVTRTKFLACDRGIFNLSYFFTSSVQRHDGDHSVSSVAVQNYIRALIESEIPQKTLSDARIAALLNAEGIDIARRTVAKYRDALGIPPSGTRRRKNGFGGES